MSAWGGQSYTVLEDWTDPAVTDIECYSMERNGAKDRQDGGDQEL